MKRRLLERDREKYPPKHGAPEVGKAFTSVTNVHFFRSSYRERPKGQMVTTYHLSKTFFLSTKKTKRKDKLWCTVGEGMKLPFLVCMNLIKKI